MQNQNSSFRIPYLVPRKLNFAILVVARVSRRSNIEILAPLGFFKIGTDD